MKPKVLAKFKNTALHQHFHVVIHTWQYWVMIQRSGNCTARWRWMLQAFSTCIVILAAPVHGIKRTLPLLFLLLLYFIPLYLVVGYYANSVFFFFFYSRAAVSVVFSTLLSCSGIIVCSLFASCIFIWTNKDDDDDDITFNFQLGHPHFLTVTILCRCCLRKLDVRYQQIYFMIFYHCIRHAILLSLCHEKKCPPS